MSKEFPVVRMIGDETSIAYLMRVYGLTAAQAAEVEAALTAKH